MLNMPTLTPFKRGAVQPIVCLKSGWALIKDQYWLFVGMSAVAILLGSIVPFGILMGPMMCGIYLSLFQLRRGQPVEFGNLFKGFDYFGESIIATLLHIIPIVVILVPFYIIFYVSLFLVMPGGSQGNEPDPATLLGFFAVMMLFAIVMMALMIIISIIFTFGYPLIVDRRLSGIEAVKLSARAALGNFWPLLGLLLLNGVIAFAGVLLCYVGALLALPVTFAAIAMAYEQVFGRGEMQSPLPPPPPVFS